MIKRKVNNKLKSYGVADTEKKTIEINKKMHKNIKKDKSLPKKSRSLIDTIVHEEMHIKHPKMHEKTVRREAPRRVAGMSSAQKASHYNWYK